MDVNRLLHLATRAGTLMLKSGGEIYRVEETICRICLAYGIQEADSFVTPTGIMVSLFHNDQTYSIVKRVKIRGVDLNKIDLINSLSREIAAYKPSLDIVSDRLDAIDNAPRYSHIKTLFFSALAAGSFTIIFGGDYRDIISAFLIGGALKELAMRFAKRGINEFFINCICSGFAAILAIIFMYLGFIPDIDETIIGSIMLLVPGLAITNAIRDTISGDFLAGVTKVFEAFFVAISIAVGTGAVLSIWFNILGGAIK